MKFSIIVPVYNISEYLPECIESILSQSFRDYELILVDDGSKDESGMICDRFAEKDTRIKVVHKENGGLVSARKAGIACASGDYILNIDGDDHIGEAYLEEVSKIADRTGADMIAWGYTRTENDGTKITTAHNIVPVGLYEGPELEKIKRSYLYDPEQDEINMGCLLYNLADKAIKKDLYEDPQLMVPDGITEGEDAAANWMILKKIRSLYVSDLDSYYYRLNSGSITGSIKVKTIEKQKELESFLLDNVDDEWQLKQIRGFSFYRIIFILDRAVKSGYSDYLKLMKAGRKERIYDQFFKADIKNISKGNALRRFLIKLGMWNVLFLYHKMRSKRNSA